MSNKTLVRGLSAAAILAILSGAANAAEMYHNTLAGTAKIAGGTTAGSSITVPAAGISATHYDATTVLTGGTGTIANLFKHPNWGYIHTHTISGWFKLDSLPESGFSTIYGFKTNGNDNNHGYQVAVTDEGKITLGHIKDYTEFRTTDDNYTIHTTENAVLAADTWYYLTVTIEQIDDSVTNARTRCKINVCVNGENVLSVAEGFQSDLGGGAFKEFAIGGGVTAAGLYVDDAALDGTAAETLALATSSSYTEEGSLNILSLYTHTATDGEVIDLKTVDFSAYDRVTAAKIVVPDGIHASVDVSSLNEKITDTNVQIEIAADAELTIAGGSISKSYVTNNGKIIVSGGTIESPIVIIEDGATNSNIGAVEIAEDSTLKIHSTSTNRKYNVTGAGSSTSTLILTAANAWGMSDGTSLSGLKLVVPSDAPAFYIERGIGNDVALVANRSIGCTNTDYTFTSISGSGELYKASWGGACKLIVTGSSAGYTGTCSLAIQLGANATFESANDIENIEAVAKIGSTYCGSLAAAKNLTVEGEKVVTLLKDLENTTEDAAAGMTLVIPEDITLTTTKRLGGWSDNNGAKLVVKGTLTVNECHMPIENKSSIEIHGGATINGTPDREGAISIVTADNVSLVMEDGDSIEIAAPICIRSNVTIATPEGTEVSIAKLLKPYWENSGGVVTKTGAGALTIGEGGIEDYVSISLSEGTINGDEGLASKITTSVSHNVVNFDNGVYSLGPDSHNIVVKSDIEHVKAEYTITHAGETSERMSVVDGAVSVVHGDKIDIYFVAEEGYEITSGETHIWYTGVKADVDTPYNPNPAIVVSSATPTRPEAIDSGSQEQQTAYAEWAAANGATGTAAWLADAFAIGAVKAEGADAVTQADAETKLASLITDEMIQKLAADGTEGEVTVTIEGYGNATFKFVPVTLGEDVTTSAKLFKLQATFKSLAELN